ncbi:hypothetical protein BH23VER1_BH23VER1_04650 [soil metagenome]
MAIPTAVDVIKEGRSAVAKRNAQAIATAAVVAVALGDEKIALASDLDMAVAMVISGSGADTAFESTDISLQNLDSDAVERAKEYLSFEDGAIRLAAGGRDGDVLVSVVDDGHADDNPVLSADSKKEDAKRIAVLKRLRHR